MPPSIPVLPRARERLLAAAACLAFLLGGANARAGNAAPLVLVTAPRWWPAPASPDGAGAAAQTDGAEATAPGADGRSGEPQAGPEQPGSPERTCGLEGADRAATPSSACRSCHQHKGHPVGMNYASTAWPGNSSALRPAARLLPQLVLDQQGNMTCATCHDGASPHAHKTALDGNKMLCLGCHDYGTSPQDYAAFPPGEAPRAEVAAAVVSPEPATTRPGRTLTRR